MSLSRDPGLPLRSGAPRGHVSVANIRGVLVRSGVPGLDDLLGGGWAPGDNAVWLTTRTDVYRSIEARFIEGARERAGLVVAANRSQLSRAQPRGVIVLDASAGSHLAGAAALADELERAMRSPRGMRILVDDFGLLVRRWGAGEAARFFVRTCPAMLQAGAVTYWRLAPGAPAALIEEMRQVTQCLLELDAGELRVLKAEGHPATVHGSSHRANLVGADVEIVADPASGRLARGLRALRADLGMTQAQLGAVAGISASAISQAESGTRGLSVDTLIVLADRLDVSLDRLVEGRTPPGYRLARYRNDVGDARTAGLLTDAAAGLRCFRVALEPGETGSPPVQHPGAELVVVASGLVSVDVRDDTPVLRAGDCLIATTSTIRRWTNLRPEPAVLFWVARD